MFRVPWTNSTTTAKETTYLHLNWLRMETVSNSEVEKKRVMETNKLKTHKE